MYTQHPRPNAFLNFLLSLVPGLSCLYLGLPRRGIGLLASFSCCVALSACLDSLLGTELLVAPFVIAAVIIYCYAFFDALHTCRSIRMGQWVDDRSEILDFLSRKPWKNTGRYKQYRLVGGILVALGGLALLQQLAFFIDAPSWFSHIYSLIRRFLLPAALMAAGIVLIVRGRQIGHTPPSSQ